MKFPVDLLADVGQQHLEKLAHEYLNTLLYSNPDAPERLTLSDSTQVSINISSVGFIPLYGQSDTERILVLFSPFDPMVAIALYLLDRWWTVEDILKTADTGRRGVLPVDTLGERIVLYILNRVIYRVKEISSEEIPFLCHGEKDHAKILWDDGEAVGFYSVKATGSLFNRFSSRAYQLPVMDSIFVRKGHRGKGSGLLMLTDFVLSSSEDSLGLKYPLSKSMYRVCEKYLRQHPEDKDLLWEVEKTGGPHQRTNIASKIQVMDLSVVSKRLPFTEESHVIKVGPDRDSISKGRGATECTLEMMEETTVLRSTKGRRLSGSRQSKLGEITEDHSGESIRIGYIAAGAPRELQGSVQQETETLHRQTEIEFNHQEAGEDTSNATPVAEEALCLNQSHRDLDEEPQDENVTSEIEEDPAGLLPSEEFCELHTGTLKQGDQVHVWRRTTTVECNDTQHRREAEEQPDEEDTLPTLDIVAVTDPDPRETAEMSEDVFVPGQLRQEERQELEGEEQMENKEELGVMGTVPEEMSAEHPDTVEPANPGGQPFSTEGLELEEGHVSDDETEEPPVVQRRRPRDRRKVCPKPRSSKQRQHKEAELEAGRSSGGQEAEDNQTEEQNQEDEDQSVDRTRDETSTKELLAVVEEDRAEESEEIVLPSPEGRRESTEVETEETAPEMDPEKVDLAEDGGEEIDGTTAADLHQPRVPEEDYTKDGELATLQHASAILVDLKTSSNHLSVMLVSGTSDPQRLASEAEEVEPIAAERTDEKPEPASAEDGTEEQNDAEDVSGNEGKEESSHLNREGEDEEEAPVMEAILLRSGRKIVKAGRQEHEGEDTAAVRTCEQDQDAGLVPAETKEEKQTHPNDGVAREVPADEEESAEERSTQPEINEEMRLEDEAPVHLQPLTEESQKKTSEEDEAEAEKQAAAPPEVGGGPLTLAENQENVNGSTSPDTGQASIPEDTFGASEEEEEELDPQGLGLQRVTVVLVDLRDSSQPQDEAGVAASVDEEEPAAEMEGEEESEAAARGPSDVPEEAVTTQTPQSGEDDEAEGVSADEEEPVAERRILRSGRKTGHARTPKRRSAAATSQRQSKRAHTHCESEERGAEEPKPELEDVTQEELRTEEEVKGRHGGVAAAEKEEILQPHSEEGEETSRDGANIPARAPRKTKRSAAAPSRRKSKRSRMQLELEEESSAEDGDEEENAKAEDREMDVGSEPRPNGQEENPLREASSVPSAEPLGDAAVVATPGVGSHGNGVKAAPGTKPPKHQMEESEKETLLDTGSGPGGPDTEEDAAMKAGQQGGEAPEREEEELAEGETGGMETGIKTDGVGDGESAESESINHESAEGIPELDTGADGDGTRAGMDEETTETDVDPPTAAAEEDHQAEDEAALSEAPAAHEPSGSTGAKEPEASDTDKSVESDLVATETKQVIDLELNTDEDEEESYSGEEEGLSDADGEPIVIGKKVLRGRTVPAVTITPHQPARRKRTRPDASPAHTARRRSRV